MKKKKIVIVTIMVIGVLVLSFFIGAGFRRRTDVVLTEYSVSEDGKKLNFNVGVMSSMGYIRGFKDGGGGVKPHYLTFFSTFGGLNSSFGAKSEFELDLDENDAEIYFCRADGGYELVLQKNVDTGEWTKPASAQTEPSVIKTYEVTNSEFVEEYFENDKLVTMVRYYEMSDETWKTDDYTYQYRLEITGRMNNSTKDSTFVFLSNIKDITFEQAWKASGFSSNMDDYFDEEDAKFVAMK